MEPTNHLQTIELLKAAKPLFENGDVYLTAAVGVFGAIGGALAAYFPTRWNARHLQRELRKSTAFQLYSEIKATLEIERHRGYTKSLYAIPKAFDEQGLKEYSYQVQVPEERFIIYKSNLANLGLLPPDLQAKIVLLYQLLEALVQDVKPGGVLNDSPVGKWPFEEALTLIERAKGIAEQILAEIEKLYPDVS